MVRIPIECLESRRLLAADLPKDVFAQPSDTYAMTLAAASGQSIAAARLTSIGWGLTVTTSIPGEPVAVADDLVVTLPAGVHSPILFNLALSSTGLTQAVFRQHSESGQLRSEWALLAPVSNIVSQITQYRQFMGANGVLYDEVTFVTPRLSQTYFVPGAGEVSTEFNFNNQSAPPPPPSFATRYMSTAPGVLSTFEYNEGQIPVIDYEMTIVPNSEAARADFTTVAGVDSVSLWSRAARVVQLPVSGRAVFQQRDAQARPLARTRFGESGARAARLVAYSFYDTTLDDSPRQDSFQLQSLLVQSISYTYDVNGKLSVSSSGWDYLQHQPMNPAPVTAFIEPPTFGPRSTPLNTFQLLFTHAVPGLTAAHFRYENLTADGIGVDSVTNLSYNVTSFAGQQTSDGDYAIKLFALGSGLASAGAPLIGSTGIKWTLDTAAPAVTLSAFEFETRQALRFDFTEDVGASLSVSDLAIENLTLGTTIPAGAVALDYSDNQARFEFPGLLNGTLPNGNYRATLAASGVTDPAGNPLAANRIVEFFVFAGDANRDRAADIGDFSILAANFNRPGTFSSGDFDYSGTTDIADFAVLAARFNQTLPALRRGPAQSPVAGPADALMRGAARFSWNEPIDELR